MNHRGMSKKNKSHLTKEFLATEFDEARDYDESTAVSLSKKECFYADQLVRRGMKVRFNEIHILSKGESSTVFSILRETIADL